MRIVDTEALSKKYRETALDLSKQSILITRFKGSEQEKDFTEPTNCQGFGRVRHFKLKPGTDWPINPLPIFPAAKALRLDNREEIRAQVFQSSVCNWRCWYCFVDYKLLNGDKRYSSYLTCDQLVDMFISEKNPPSVIDLSGGQPDLTPEWVPWMMQALRIRGLEKDVFLWSDDNLSNDYFWRYLSSSQIDTILSYKMYSRVCCFKGVDGRSFQINTKADATLFSKQIEYFKRFFELGIDLYGYITLTAPSDTNFKKVIPIFLDEIQSINESLPLRIVPLKVFEFSPMKPRVGEVERDCLRGQYLAIDVWEKELDKRFSKSKRELPITDVL